MSAQQPDAGAPDERPVVRIEHGSPSAEELAVLVALLSAVGGGGVSGLPDQPRSRWSAPDVRLRSTGPGHGAWRFSGMPI